VPGTGDWFDRLPKVELHLHVQGAIPHGALWEVIRKYGGDPRVPDPSALADRFVYRGFQDFIDAWVWVRGFMREYEDLVFTTEAVARELVRQNVRYAEVFFSPSDYHANGLETQRVTEAYRRGLSRVDGIEVALIADVVRDSGPEQAMRTLAELREVRNLGIVGIGLGGSEHLVPAELFESVFEEARRAGFRTTAHAGEAAGPESVWGALRSLRVDRLGHATRASEDPELVAHLSERGVPIEVCPTSNVRTGVVPSLRDHPVRRYFEAGIVVTINTDDPAMFGTGLAQEYRAIRSECGFSRTEILELVLNGIASSWAGERRRSELERSFRADPAWSEGP
jgi:adenosine deaminase